MWAALGGAALNGGLQFLGQERANAENRKINDNNMTFNAAEAEKSRQFEQNMSNTAVRRSVNDMEQAGINPMMAANQSASTPSGATASNSGGANQQNSMSGAVASAMEGQALSLASSKNAREGELSTKTGNLTDQQSQLAKASKDKAIMETAVLAKSLPEAEAKNAAWKWAKTKLSEATAVNSAGERQRHIKINPPR